LTPSVTRFQDRIDRTERVNQLLEFIGDMELVQNKAIELGILYNYKKECVTATKTTVVPE
jgi:hypothetical protein